MSRPTGFSSIINMGFFFYHTFIIIIYIYFFRRRVSRRLPSPSTRATRPPPLLSPRTPLPPPPTPPLTRNPPPIPLAARATPVVRATTKWATDLTIPIQVASTIIPARTFRPGTLALTVRLAINNQVNCLRIGYENFLGLTVHLAINNQVNCIRIGYENFLGLTVRPSKLSADLLVDLNPPHIFGVVEKIGNLLQKSLRYRRYSDIFLN